MHLYFSVATFNKANASNTEAAFLDLNLSIHNDTVSTKIYDKWDDLRYDLVDAFNITSRYLDDLFFII